MLIAKDLKRWDRKERETLKEVWIVFCNDDFGRWVAGVFFSKDKAFGCRNAIREADHKREKSVWIEDHKVE